MDGRGMLLLKNRNEIDAEECIPSISFVKTVAFPLWTDITKMQIREIINDQILVCCVVAAT
jgi:methionine salvage enolase-phosphatase E1